MKFKALTKLPKPKQTKPKQTKSSKSTNYLFPLSLNIEISKNYKGLSDNIAGIIDTLPKPLKTLYQNAQLVRVVNRQGYSLFVLDNKFTIKVEDVFFARKNKQRVTIKHGKKTILNHIF